MCNGRQKNKTSYTYDLFGRLKSVQLPGVNLKTNYSYDLNGNRFQAQP
ncbi:hypothetical protein GE107_08470 [Cohnella sp. CFH 77786]|nr:hypothetical protein [Cohnella sp. CFH 77786]